MHTIIVEIMNDCKGCTSVLQHGLVYICTDANASIDVQFFFFSSACVQACVHACGNPNQYTNITFSWNGTAYYYIF